MRSIHATLSVTLGLVLGVHARAQCNGFQTGTISDQNVSFSLSSMPSGPGAGQALADFTADAANQADIFKEIAFFYRLDGDTRETALNTGAMQCIDSSWQAGQGTIEWTDVDGRGLIKLAQRYRVLSSSVNGGCVEVTATVTNISNRVVTLDLFAFCDIDHCTVDRNIAVSANSNSTRHRILNGLCNAVSFFEGVGADRWEADLTAGLRNRLADGTINDLQNLGLTLFGDYTAAMQWANRLIGAGESAAFVVKICHNQDPGQCTVRAGSVNYGAPLAGTNGVATITTAGLPRLGQESSVDIRNGFPLTTGMMLIGATRANISLGLATLWTNPISTSLLELDRMGAGVFTIGIPDVSTLCGAKAQLQFLFVDAAVMGPVPIAHTDAVEWTIGG